MSYFTFEIKDLIARVCNNLEYIFNYIYLAIQIEKCLNS